MSSDSSHINFLLGFLIGLYVNIFGDELSSFLLLLFLIEIKGLVVLISPLITIGGSLMISSFSLFLSKHFQILR